MSTVGLAMIARDEAANIGRALDSVKPLINFALIEDTGSTDGTQQIVTEWLKANHVPGEVIEKPWRDFAYNRSWVLAKLRENIAIDYALILDADDVLTVDGDPEAIKRGLATDAYMVPIYHGNLRHRRTQVCSNRKPFRFRGVVHEFLHCDEPFKQEPLNGLSIQIVGGGVRGRNGSDVYRRDADLLSRAIASGEDEDLKPRYMFYLAQSWRDCGEGERALAAYLQRADIGGWIEETYMALVNAARLMSQLERPLVKVLDVWKRAMGLIPTRVEAYHGAAVACRNAGCLHEALAFARRGIGRSQPEGLFIEPWIYQYGLLDEYAVAAYWTDLPGEALLAGFVILGQDDIDASTRARIAKNAAFAKAKCVNAN